jgi:signal transduction histidine kinase/DNA-binding response OmpR family regulator
MRIPLSILLLEDSVQDAELIQELLEADHFVCDIARVQTRAEFVAALENGGIDLVLADYKLPSFDGLSALQLTLSARPDVPFIFVSGFGEEIAIEALTSGAKDYVLKTGLSRLVPAVQRALREARERAERKKSEVARLRILLLEDSIQDAELIQDLLEADHFVCEVTRVQTRTEFVVALEAGGFDLILADYKLPSFDGLSALKLALSARPDLPFIFVSGFGEEIAIEALTSGATDYVLKTRLSRLVPSVQRSLREARERDERKKAEVALRRNEMYLAEAERLSQTGSFGWNASTGELYWSDGTYRIFECEPTTKPTIQLVIDRTHPEDRMGLHQILDRAAEERCDFIAEHRLLMADGSVKYVQAAAHRLIGEDPERLVFVGAITDVTERKRAEEERERLRQLEADLARMNRVSMMGELAASLGHEIMQPIAAAAMNARACLRWLQRESPEIGEARQTVSRIISNVERAAGIIDRNRSLYRRGTPQYELIDLNEIIRQMVILLHDAANRHSVSIRTELHAALPMTKADRVQLQQVLMNLMLNGIEAMQDESGELSVTSKKTEDGQLLISVSDLGIGLPGEEPERIFEAFFTSKPQGTGMGLSISRRIIESLGGRLWASSNTGRGATFQFTLPNEVMASSPQAV